MQTIMEKIYYSSHLLEPCRSSRCREKYSGLALDNDTLYVSFEDTIAKVDLMEPDPGHTEPIINHKMKQYVGLSTGWVYHPTFCYRSTDETPVPRYRFSRARVSWI